MDHAFFEAAAPRPDPEDLRAAMLQVDFIALRLRVAVAKADLQLRSARFATLEHSTRERLRASEVGEEQRNHLEELRTAVTQYAHLLGTTGASREQVVALVRETVDGVTTRGMPESTTVRSVVTSALRMYRDAPAA